MVSKDLLFFCFCRIERLFLHCFCLVLQLLGFCVFYCRKKESDVIMFKIDENNAYAN